MLEPKVLNVTPLEDYRLFVEWKTGEKRIFDVKPYIMSSWFGQLHDVQTFRLYTRAAQRLNGLTVRTLRRMNCMSFPKMLITVRSELNPLPTEQNEKKITSKIKEQVRYRLTCSFCPMRTKGA